MCVVILVISNVMLTFLLTTKTCLRLHGSSSAFVLVNVDNDNLHFLISQSFNISNNKLNITMGFWGFGVLDAMVGM